MPPVVVLQVQMDLGTCQGISRMGLCLRACGIQTVECLEAVLGHSTWSTDKCTLTLESLISSLTVQDQVKPS